MSALDEVLLRYATRERELRLEAAGLVGKGQPLSARKARGAADLLNHARQLELTDPPPLFMRRDGEGHKQYP